MTLLMQREFTVRSPTLLSEINFNVPIGMTRNNKLFKINFTNDPLN